MTPGGVVDAALALLGLSLPGLLLVNGVLPYWQGYRLRPAAHAAMRGANAAVVGLHAAALYRFVRIRSILSPVDFGVARVGLTLLTVGCTPPLVVCVVSAVAGMLLA